MLEHDEAGSAVTLPPPAVPVVVLLDSLLPPPQPAAANASAAKMPTSATALKLVLTLPPLSRGFRRPRCHDRGSIRSAQAACKRDPTRATRGPFARTMESAPKWRNWQTRRTQNPVPFGECGFDSHLRHLIVERKPASAHEARPAGA